MRIAWREASARDYVAPFDWSTIWRLTAGIIAAAIFSVPNSSRAIDLVGIVRPASLDQPQINLLLRNTDGGAPIHGETSDPFDPFSTIPTINIGAYLDTGSSSILLSTTTATNWNLPLATFNGQTVKYTDIGIGGTALFNVSQPLYVGFAPSTPSVNDQLQGNDSYSSQIAAYYSQQAGPLRTQIGPITDPTNLFTQDPDLAFLVDDLNIAGMPAMTGKVTVIDARAANQAARDINKVGLDNYIFGDLNNLNNLSLRTYLYSPGTPFHPATPDTDPGIPDTKLHVKLSYGSFDRFTTTSPSGATGPTLQHNPFIGPNPLRAIDPTLPPDNTPGIKISFSTDPSHVYSAEGSFLFDTGAGASFISQNMAAQLHVRYRPGTLGTDNPQLESFDPTNPAATGSLLSNQFQLSVGGIGGSSTASGFYLDSLLIRSMEGNPQVDLDPRHLLFKSAPVLVTDITVQDQTNPAHPTLTLDGDLGMNFLMAGLELSTAGGTFNVGNFAAGAFDWLTFDEAKGTLGLALSSGFHIRGDFDLDGKLTNADLQAMLAAMKDLDAFASAHNLSGNDAFALADVNQDGVINAADVQMLLAALTKASSSPQNVPEPASWLLMGMAICSLRAFRTRFSRAA